MEFKTLKNIESSFRHLRLFSMLFLGACTLISVAAVWTSYRFAEAQRQKIYVLDQGKSLILALSQDMAQNRPVEAREHVRRFHELFFTLSPDREAIEGNVRRALYLADGSAIAYYQSLAENISTASSPRTYRRMSSWTASDAISTAILMPWRPSHGRRSSVKATSRSGRSSRHAACEMPYARTTTRRDS